jgi:hypothetical protein
MFGRRRPASELAPPPIASANGDALEILRVWASPGHSQQVTLRTNWEDPAAWGLLLVDVARHAARAYQREGQNAEEALQRIRQGFDAEWSAPTDLAEDLTDDV